MNINMHVKRYDATIWTSPSMMIAGSHLLFKLWLDNITDAVAYLWIINCFKLKYDFIYYEKMLHLF